METTRKNIRVIALILVVVMSLSVFVGCIPNTNNGNNAGNNDQNNSGNGVGGSNDGSSNGENSNTDDPSDNTHTCTFGNWVVVKEPTNDEDGLQERKCGCGAVEQKVIKASGSEYFIIYRNLKSADYPEQNGYNSNEGLLDLPQPEAEGYTFIGWYTASIGGELVDYIPEGSTQNYILYAHWDLVSYDITYKNVPNNANPTSYDIEDKLKLETPKWSGLVFTHWSDEEGNTYFPNENITTLPENISGDLTLTANWKVLRNIATPAGEGAELSRVYSGDEGLVFFFYDLGTIEHVVLDDIDPNLYYKSEGMPISLTLSKTVTIGEETAKTISNTISKSITSSQSWNLSYDFAETHSKNWNSEISAGIETEVGGGWETEIGGEVGGNIGGDDGEGFTAGLSAKFSASHKDFYNWSVKSHIDTTYSWGGEDSTTEQWGESFGQSYEESDTYSKDITSSLAYKQEISSEVTENYSIGADLPSGYYAYVHAGNIRVIAVVTYDTATGNLYLNTYSRLDNMHSMIMYYSDVNQLNNPSVEGLDFTIPEDEIVNFVNNSYYIKYDANGGEGTMPTTLHSVDGNEKLATNTFTNSGKLFVGWELKTDDGVKILLDGQSVTNLGSALETVTLKAIWEKDPALDVVYDLKTVSGSYTSEPQISYSALIQYRNRTSNSVEIRVIWTATKHSGYNYHAQNVEFSVGNATSGTVVIVPEGDWENGYSSRTAESPWFTVSLDTADAASINLKVHYWQESRGNKVNDKINTYWTIDIPAY